jgi:hypothetical protein
VRTSKDGMQFLHRVVTLLWCRYCHGCWVVLNVCCWFRFKCVPDTLCLLITD